jgi:asparagine synthase (glutamine-hydrolysing)
MDFLIFPDTPAAAAVAQTAVAQTTAAQTAAAQTAVAQAAVAQIGGAGGRVVRHASGRPWLVGEWTDAEATLVTAGRRRLATLGHTRLSLLEATRALARARSPHDLDALAAALPGSAYLVVSIDGWTRSQGSLSTSRQVFRATVDGTPVAATDPGLLTALTGAQLDTDALALRLLTPAAPWPLAQRCVWSGVSEVDAGSWLEIGPDGGSRTVRWWRPPRADVPLDEAAGQLRDALVDALAVRVDGGRKVSVDLSGGLDSTSLCFLAEAGGADLLTHHWTALDRGNDDAAWARQAAAYLPGARHRVNDADEAPAWFATAESGTGAVARYDVEGPPSWHRNREHMAQLSLVDAGEGVRLHLVGLGGDELFGALPSHLWSLVRRHPVRSLPLVHRFRVVNRWRLGATVRGLLDRQSFAASLRAAARAVTAPPPRPTDVLTGWHGAPRLPQWATGDARDTVQRLMREAADADPAPLDPDRCQHQLLESAMRGGAAIRQLRYAFAGAGVQWDAPYLDDRVIEAAMAVRIEDRAGRGLYKPVLVAAMRGLVPDPLLARRSKGEYTAEAYEGLMRNRRRLLELCEDLRLHGLGLVDAGALRAALLAPGPEARHLNPFDNTLACENWLRADRTAAPAATTVGGTR